MNNHDLLMENSTDLRAGLYEGLDFTLFPESLYKTFESIFGGGPSICRKVIKVKSNYSSRTSIELYPVKVEIFMESDVSQAEDASKLQPSTSIYLSRTYNIQQSFDAICKENGLSADKCRLWIYIGTDDDDSDQEDDTSKGRKLTAEITDKVDGWVYLRKLSNHETLGHLNVSSIKIMLECLALDVTSGNEYWPKEEALNEWKNHLRVGDVVDAEDECGEWYESEIKLVDIHTR
jgi:hypothetical protein